MTIQTALRAAAAVALVGVGACEPAAIPLQVVPAVNTCDYGRLYEDTATTMSTASGSQQFLTCAQMTAGGPWQEVDGEIDVEGEAAVEVGGLLRAVPGGEGMTVSIVATYRGVSGSVQVLITN